MEGIVIILIVILLYLLVRYCIKRTRISNSVVVDRTYRGRQCSNGRCTVDCNGVDCGSVAGQRGYTSTPNSRRDYIIKYAGDPYANKLDKVQQDRSALNIPEVDLDDPVDRVVRTASRNPQSMYDMSDRIIMSGDYGGQRVDIYRTADLLYPVEQDGHIITYNSSSDWMRDYSPPLLSSSLPLDR